MSEVTLKLALLNVPQKTNNYVLYISANASVMGLRSIYLDMSI